MFNKMLQSVHLNIDPYDNVNIAWTENECLEESVKDRGVECIEHTALVTGTAVPSGTFALHDQVHLLCMYM